MFPEVKALLLDPTRSKERIKLVRDCAGLEVIAVIATGAFGFLGCVGGLIAAKTSYLWTGVSIAAIGGTGFVLTREMLYVARNTQSIFNANLLGARGAAGFSDEVFLREMTKGTWLVGPIGRLLAP